jgi:methionyl-tRNA synthetase
MSHRENDNLMDLKIDSTSDCCNADMIGGVQCEACGSDGIMSTEEKNEIIDEKIRFNSQE